MALLEIKAVSRYIEVLRPDGSLVSRHVTIEDAIESAANSPAGVLYRVRSPERTVKVYGSLPLPGGDTQAPTVPGNPTFVSKGATTITFSWSASTDNVGVDGYQVFRNGSPIATTSQTSYTDSGLTPSTQYTYAVAAYDAAGNNSGTTGQTPLVVTTNANAAPAWSVGTQALTTNTSYNLSLTDVCSDADSNPITFSVLSGTLPTGVTFNSVAKTVSGTPTAVGTQVVTFRATDGIVNSDQAITFEVLNADTTAPPVPAMNAVTNIAASSVTCSWGAVTDTTVANARTSGGVVYTLQRATNSGFTTGVVTESPQSGLSANLSGLSALTQYFFRVKSRDAAGNESAYSSSVNATTIAAGGNNNPDSLPVTSTVLFSRDYETQIASEIDTSPTIVTFEHGAYGYGGNGWRAVPNPLSGLHPGSAEDSAGWNYLGSAAVTLVTVSYLLKMSAALLNNIKSNSNGGNFWNSCNKAMDLGSGSTRYGAHFGKQSTSLACEGQPVVSDTNASSPRWYLVSGGGGPYYRSNLDWNQFADIWTWICFVVDIRGGTAATRYEAMYYKAEGMTNVASVGKVLESSGFPNLTGLAAIPLHVLTPLWGYWDDMHDREAVASQLSSMSLQVDRIRVMPGWPDDANGPPF